MNVQLVLPEIHTQNVLISETVINQHGHSTCGRW